MNAANIKIRKTKERFVFHLDSDFITEVGNVISLLDRIFYLNRQKDPLKAPPNTQA